MNAISVSNLKTNPAKAIRDAEDFPVAIEKRNVVKAYLIGKDLYEKIVSYIEDYIDASTVEKTDFTKGHSLEDVAKELDL